MPCYHWKGIDLKGAIHSGTRFYRSENHLEQDLLSKNIGLVKWRIKNYKLSVPIKIKDLFIEHLYNLLKSQIRLYQAIELASHSIAHPYFKQIIEDIGLMVLEGQPLYQALENYQHIFDRLTISVIYVGEQSSNLTNAFEQLVVHKNRIREFKSKLQSALLIPVLTFGFFIAIMTSFFIFIVPRFETFFKSFKAPLPKITQLILSFSAFLRSNTLFYILLGCILFYFLFKILKIPFLSSLKDKLLYTLPFIKNSSLMVGKLRFLQILSLSLSSGMHLLGCLNLSYTITESDYLKKIIKGLKDAVENGVNLSTAISKSAINDVEIVALIKIGESSGNLEQMISRALILYQKKFYDKIDQISTLIHPIILLILGALIALAIFAVYVPIFTLTLFIN